MNETIVDRIDQILEKKGLIRQNLADDVGITTATICFWATRNSIPKADIALKVAKFLGVSVEYLITGKDSKWDSDVYEAAELLQSMTPDQRKLAISLVKTQYSVQQTL